MIPGSVVVKFMEVIDPSSSWLCDFEVFKHLSESKQSRNPNVRLSENILTVEFEVRREGILKVFIRDIDRLLTTLRNFHKFPFKAPMLSTV
jgi:hypothetical protein